MANTPNLGLHQWQPDDSFLREDFNTDLAKIDTAVSALQAAMPQVLLRQYATTTAAQTVSLSLTGIDWASYRQVIIYIEASVTTEIQGYVRFNKKAGVSDYQYSLIDSGSGMRGADFYSTMFVGSSNTRITLECTGNSVSGTTQTMGYRFNLIANRMSTYAAATLTALTEMNLTTLDSSLTFPAGTKFTVYGVKK